MVKERFFSFTLVVGTGFLLLVSLVLSTALSAVGGVVGGLLPESELLLSIVNFVLSFVVITVLFALIYLVLPDARIGWRDVWVGAAITSVLFQLGKKLIGHDVIVWVAPDGDEGQYRVLRHIQDIGVSED